MNELKKLTLEEENFDSFPDQKAREDIKKLKANPPEGKPGKDGVGISSVWIDDSGYLYIRNTLGEEVNLGKVVGPQGEPGKDGVGLAWVWIDENGYLHVRNSQGGEISVGKVVGDPGEKGDSGEKGADGKDGQDGADGKDGQDGAAGKSVHFVGVSQEFKVNASAGVSLSGFYSYPEEVKIGDWVISKLGSVGQITGLTATNARIIGTGISLKGPVGETGADGKDGQDGADGRDGKSAYAYAQEGGYTGTEEEFAAKMALAPHKSSVKTYGATGDGVTDDTAAVQAALAAERVVYIPGGTYRLMGPLTIRENCELELAQDTVLQFEQTEGNAITLLRLATLRGNHATVFVPYAFDGNVINADTGDDEAALGDLSGDALKNADSLAVPPFRKWCPMWKMSRYVTDINICKRTADGFHQSSDGACYGTAVNLHCDEADLKSYMWGVDMSGLRIAGGFNYGIHAHNEGDHMESWNHDMRIEAVIDACKIGVMIENCYYSHFAVTIQPREAIDNTLYAEHGIKIVDSQGVDLSSSRVWDWENGDKSLWTAGGEHQHIALVGNCQGLILDDYLCHKVSDIREHIYTDRAANFDTMTILQEPGNKWFRSRDGEPYFYNGIGELKLMTRAELDAYFSVETVKAFEDVLATATDTDGTVYNGIGYKRGVRFAPLSDGVTISASDMYMLTGFIPVVCGQTIYCADLRFDNPNDNYGYAGLVCYDANKTPAVHPTSGQNLTVNIATLLKGNGYYVNYADTSGGCSLEINNVGELKNVQYVRLVFPIVGVGENPMISIDDPVKYTAEGFLSDGVKVKGESVVLTSAGGKAYTLTVSDTGTLTAVEMT